MIRVLALYQNGWSTFNPLRRLLISRLEKKLTIVLKTILVLEAIAKVVFIVKDLLIQKRMLLRPSTFFYSHVYRYLQLLLVASLQITHCARTALSPLPLSISLIGLIPDNNS